MAGRPLLPAPCSLLFMGLGRVELPTSRLSGVRSNHLSYRPCRRPNSKGRNNIAEPDGDRNPGGGCARRRAGPIGRGERSSASSSSSKSSSNSSSRSSSSSANSSSSSSNSSPSASSSSSSKAYPSSNSSSSSSNRRRSPTSIGDATRAGIVVIRLSRTEG